MKLGKTTKIGAIVGSLLGLLSSVAVITFLVLGLCGVFPLDNEEVNKYHIVFVANEKVLSDEYYNRGELINTDFRVPSKPDDDKATDYHFIGWDTNGDNLVNVVPVRAYRTFTAVAIYKGTIVINSESESPASSSSSSRRGV